MGAAATLETLAERLQSASARSRDADDHAKAERERRDMLVVDAFREGASYRKVTEWSGLSRTRIIAILANNG